MRSTDDPEGKEAECGDKITLLGDPAAPAHLRQHYEKQGMLLRRCHALPPRLCPASGGAHAVPLGPLVDAAPIALAVDPTLVDSSPLRVTKAHLFADGASSMPSSCGATTDADNRFGVTQSDVSAIAAVGPVQGPSSSPSLPRLATTPPLILNAPTFPSVLVEETVSYAVSGNHVKSSSDPISMIPLCSSPPHEHAGEQGRLASSMNIPSTALPVPQDEMGGFLSEPLSPTTIGRTSVSRAVLFRPGGFAEVRGTASPGVTPTGSPTGLTGAVGTRSTGQRHGRVYETPLSFATGVGVGSCDDFPRCNPERSELPTTNKGVRTTDLARERPSEPHRHLPFHWPSDPITNTSTLTAAAAGSAVTTAIGQVHPHNCFIGGTAPHSSNGSTNGGDGEAQPGACGGLTRALSCETLVSVSSSRSRPVLTPAVHGIPGVSGAGSGTASNTTTSVTYTRKNVCVGGLDFHGHPVTSLSSLLVHMAQPSADHEDGDQSETRLGPASPHSIASPHQQRNTLSMQNLMAHTQQVGEMAPEDKVKRFHARPDGMGLFGVQRGKGTMMTRPRCTYTKPSKLRVASSASCAPLTTCTPASSSKPHVGSLKDVLQECNFLSLNDVMSAIADTHVHEIHEARQRLGNTQGESKQPDSLSASMATVPSTANVPSLSTVPLLSQTEDSAGTGSCSAGCAPSPASSRPTIERVEPAGPPSTEEGGGGVCRSPSVSTDNTCPPALYVSVRTMDTQQVLTLAAAITEVSLNLDRNTEMSFPCSTNASAFSPPQLSLTSRTRLFGGISEAGPVANTSDVGTDSLRELPTQMCDPLEHKVLRRPSNEEIDDVFFHEVRGSSEESTANALFPSGRDRHVYGSPLRAIFADDAQIPATAFPTESLQSGRYLAKWKGLSIEGEVPSKDSSPRTAGDLSSVSFRTSIPGPLQRGRETCTSERYGWTSVVKQEETVHSINIPTRASSHGLHIAGEAVTPAAKGLPMIESITLLPFDDELHTTLQLRQWARSIARLEQLEPTTDTEVTT